jgi:predicted transposase YbfD/YdcC
LCYVLGVAVAATAAVGHDSISALAQWAAEVPSRVLACLGGRADPFTGQVAAPSRHTFGRVLAGVDVAKFQAAADAWTATAVGADNEPELAPETEGDTDGDEPTDGAESELRLLPAIAIDGKSVRGAAAGGGQRPHLLAAATHNTNIVLTQRQIPDKGSEIHELAGLVEQLDLRGRVVTIDALHTQRATAEHLVTAKAAHYLMTVKANQPTLFEACQRVLLDPPGDTLAEYVTTDRGHGRTEQRTTRVVAVTDDHGIDWPHATHVFRIRRDTGDLHGQRLRKEIAYGITSLPADHASPAALDRYTRGHWTIENQTHWVRDVTFAEDASTVRTGTAPHVMATIRNMIITALRLTGWVNLAQARRHYVHHPNRCADLINKPLETDKSRT